MVIILSHPMSAPEIRVLQEYRRIGAETMTRDAIKAIKHPAGGGIEPAVLLAGKGYLTSDEGGLHFTLTAKGKDFIALDVKPEVETAGPTDEAAVE